MDMEKLRVQDLMPTDVKMVSKGTTIFDAAKKGLEDQVASY